MRIAPLTAGQAREICTWRYAGPWSVYDGSAPPPDPADGFVAVVDDHTATGAPSFVGFACFGTEARVPGLAPEPDLLDVGIGMRPDLVGHGLGRRFLGTVLAHARTTFQPVAFRCVVQEWNRRSLRVVEAMGFVPVETLDVPQGGATVRYVVLHLAVPQSDRNGDPPSRR